MPAKHNLEIFTLALLILIFILYWLLINVSISRKSSLKWGICYIKPEERDYNTSVVLSDLAKQR